MHSAVCEHTKKFYESEARRFKAKVAACLFLVQGDQICLQRRSGTGLDDGLYTVPMGCVEHNEAPSRALIREAKEEINITIHPEHVHLVHAMYRKHVLPDGYAFFQQDLFFKVSTYQGELLNLEPHKADDVRFFNFNDLPTKLVPHIKQAIEYMHTGQTYSEFGI